MPSSRSTASLFLPILTGVGVSVALGASGVSAGAAPTHGPTQGPTQGPTDGFEAARGVLEARCLPCHGGEHRMSGLSFADAETFAAGGARGSVLRPEELTKSRLLEVIEYGNPDLAMPPSGILPEEERAVLRRWIESGAPWPDDASGVLADASRHPAAREAAKVHEPWWAYEPLQRPEVPAAHGAIHPIDAFLSAGWAANGLEPAPLASPEALLRRASFDLIGLPPSPRSRRDFLAGVAVDGFDSAWSAALDRLFADPGYGEAEARQWLDLVRYAETDGYERDSQKRNIWRYRDWVIRAFNRDMPYDQFVQLQLAGDEYAAEAPSRETRDEALLATGFYRVPVFDDEPTDFEQAKSDEHADIVDTVSQVIFGTTMGCARCHDHKADPLAQAEYFGLTAHFRGVTRYAKNGTRDIADTPAPGVMRVEERDRQVARTRERLIEVCSSVPAAIQGSFTSNAAIQLVPDARGRRPESDAATWAFRQTDQEPLDSQRWTQPAFDDSDWKRGPGGFGRRGTPASIIGTDWHRKHIQLRTTFQLDAIPSLLGLTLHHDDDVRVYLNGTLVYEASGYLVDYADVQLPSAALDALVIGRNVLSVSCVQDFGGQYIDVGLRSGSFDEKAQHAWLVKAEALAQMNANGDAKQAPGKASGQAVHSARRLLAEYRALESAPVASPYPAHVAYEYGPVPEQQFIELRGSVHALGDPVEPTVPEAWLVGSSRREDGYSLADVEPIDTPVGPSSGRRKHLAEWAFDGGAHLTARVEANRVWQFLFGRGLCRTPGDFGRLGELPTDTRLLDYLASELIARNWSRKSLQRWIMESEAYRRATSGPVASSAKDPRDERYWRFPPRRLTAEEFRDAVLATSGELVRDSFGPWVYPPLAAEVLATASRPDAAWGRSSERDAVRRSLYVHVKRSLRHPLLSALDQPDPDIACPSRFPTNVPTQALLTLNGTFTQARAAAMAKQLMEKEGTDDRLRSAIERAFGREAQPSELERGAAFLETLQQDHSLTEERALAIYALGLFNRNEFMWLD